VIELVAAVMKVHVNHSLHDAHRPFFTSWWFFTNPFEKYAKVKNGNLIFPKIGLKIKDI